MIFEPGLKPVKSARAVQLTQSLSRECARQPPVLSDSPRARRRPPGNPRRPRADSPLGDEVVAWIYIAAVTSTLVWSWGGLGQAVFNRLGATAVRRPDPAWLMPWRRPRQPLHSSVCYASVIRTRTGYPGDPSMENRILRSMKGAATAPQSSSLTCRQTRIG